MYKLEGLDNQWIQTSDNRVISYSNLTHGKYIFKLKAANSDGSGIMMTQFLLSLYSHAGGKHGGQLFFLY